MEFVFGFDWEDVAVKGLFDLLCDEGEDVLEGWNG